MTNKETGKKSPDKYSYRMTDKQEKESGFAKMMYEYDIWGKNCFCIVRRLKNQNKYVLYTIYFLCKALFMT